VIGVIGTDVYVAYENNTTTVICYQGVVSVTPLGSARAQNNTGQSNAASNTITVAAGQMVEITTEIPPGGFQPSQVPPSAAQNGILATNIPEKEGPPVHHGHTWQWVAIGTAVGLGLGLGIYYGSHTATGTQGCVPSPVKGC
jgi:hypothetical protein